MSDFLARVARRASSSGSVARLRPTARFERSDPAPLKSPLGPGARAEVVAERVVPLEASAPSGAVPGAASDAPPWGAKGPRPEVPEDTPLPVPVARSADRRRGRAEAVVASAAPPVGAESPSEPAPAARQPTPRPDLDDPATWARPRSQAVDRTGPGPDTLGTDDLLVRHVVPALVGAGLLGDTDVSVVREPASAPTRPPGPDARPVVRVADEPWRSTSGGDVHVHIARVEVVAPSPAPTPPARARAPRPPLVDHDAYLAARRGERS